MNTHIKSILSNRKLMRYFIMALVIVSLEMTSFQIIYLILNDYIAATVISFIVGVILNWFGGRIFIFGKSQHNPTKEFCMILIGSLVGVALQLIIVHLFVTILHLIPILGKAASIVISFFWNYLFRLRIVYK